MAKERIIPWQVLGARTALDEHLTLCIDDGKMLAHGVMGDGCYSRWTHCGAEISENGYDARLSQSIARHISSSECSCRSHMSLASSGNRESVRVTECVFIRGTSGPLLSLCPSNSE
jgi:hypothetical protein